MAAKTTHWWARQSQSSKSSEKVEVITSVVTKGQTAKQSSGAMVPHWEGVRSWRDCHPQRCLTQQVGRVHPHVHPESPVTTPGGSLFGTHTAPHPLFQKERLWRPWGSSAPRLALHTPLLPWGSGGQVLPNQFIFVGISWNLNQLGPWHWWGRNCEH